MNDQAIVAATTTRELIIDRQGFEPDTGATRLPTGNEMQLGVVASRVADQRGVEITREDQQIATDISSSQIVVWRVTAALSS